MVVGFDIRRCCRLANAYGSGGPSGEGKGSRLAEAIGSGRPEQSSVGGLDPDEGENAWIKE